ncbi:hypothetical protein KEM56_003120 [Ascosphaera pollenicola]|nr:hypothetical protein KEM56_003120 [Ascosphaera pollenicola]
MMNDTMISASIGSVCEDTRERKPAFKHEHLKLGHILYIDAYDSFSYNVIDMVEETTGAEVTCITMDRFEAHERTPGFIEELLQRFDGVVLGPGPGTPLNPNDIGIMKEIIAYGRIPMFGICLGFQTLCHHFGASVGELEEPKHGRVVKLAHAGNNIFRDVPESFDITLYHSLRVKLGHRVEDTGSVTDAGFPWKPSASCPTLLPLAWYHDEDTGKGVLMGVRHGSLPMHGVQFHPESCASSSQCKKLICNWAADARAFNSSRSRTGKPMSMRLCPTEQRVSGEIWTQNFLGPLAGEADSYAFRALDLGELTAESINEVINEAGQQNVVLESDSRYSIISAPSPSAFTMDYSLVSKKLSLTMIRTGRSDKHHDVPVQRVWSEIQNYIRVRHLRRSDLTQRSIDTPEIPFWGGYLGFVSYEMGLDFYDFSQLDLHPASKDLAFIFVDRSVVIDKKEKKVFIQSLRRGENLPGEWIDTTSKRLFEISHKQASTGNGSLSVSTNEQSLDEDSEANKMVEGAQIHMPEEWTYKKQILECQKYIRQGDSYELCLTAETKITLPACQSDEANAHMAWLLYKRLRKYNPGAYSGYLRLCGVDIVSSSPECFMQWDRLCNFEMKPMKGTVRKGGDMTLDKARMILRSEKELGENLMIADLIRHDLTELLGSRSTNVEKLCAVEDHGRVYQMITHVKSKPEPHKIRSVAEKLGIPANSVTPHDFDALRSTLPPGSMTGAPKIRSCHILADIEKRQRGVYSGAMGYLDVGGAGSFSVIIRTAFHWQDQQSKESVWRIGAGGAVTVLSTPEGEWEEMLTKLNTVLEVFKTSSVEKKCSKTN